LNNSKNKQSRDSSYKGGRIKDSLSQGKQTIQTIRIATRNSPLALWQANYVRDRLLSEYADLKVKIIGMTTKGDQILDKSLSKVGGKGLFLKELEDALLNDRADIAVHSMKDVTVDLPKGLEITCVFEREQANDAFVSNRFHSLRELPQGAVVGTSSLRRKAQLRHHFPELNIQDLRGNVNTRLSKLDAGEYDAIILAAAGLIRLGFASRITDLIDYQDSLPAVGQGIVGVECRQYDENIIQFLQPLNDENAQICLTAERSLNAQLDGGCSVPIAGYAQLKNGTLHLKGIVGDVETGELLIAQAEGLPEEAEVMGIQVAKDLLAQGAEAYLEKARKN